MTVEEIFRRELGELDPYALMAEEAGRIDAFSAALDPDAWRAPTACDGWDRHDLMAHLAGSEEYNHACLDDAIDSLMTRALAADVTDVDSFNRWAVETRRGVDDQALLAEWRGAEARTRAGLAAIDGADVATMVGPYPARWQAFHLAAELATHADDLGIAGPDDESGQASRWEWRARAVRFFLAETHPDLAVEPTATGTAISIDGTPVILDDRSLVQAANGRLPDDAPFDSAVSAALSLLP